MKKKLFILRTLGLNHCFKLIVKRMVGINHYYVTKRRLVSIDVTKRRRPNFALSKINEDDINQIVEKAKLLDAIDRQELVVRMQFYMAGFKNCYVAKNKDGDIAYLQWLIYPTENDIIKKHFHRIFPPLKDYEVMIENVYTFPKYRGLGLIQSVTPKLLNIAKEEGYKSAVAFIRKDRFAAINELLSMGFKITRMIREYRFLGMTKRMI